MIAVSVSAHAVERYMERAGARTEAEAMAALTSPAVKAAASFGCSIVRHGNVRIVLQLTRTGAAVITVIPFSEWRPPHQLLPHSCGGPLPASQLPAFKERSHVWN